MRIHLILLCATLFSMPFNAIAETASDAPPILLLVNQVRAQERHCGKQHYPAVPPLQWHDALAAIAAEHALDMANHNYFSHTDRQGRSPHQRIKAAMNYAGTGSAENISAGSRTEQETLSDWLNSPDHCQNIMNPKHTHMGMGVATNPNSRFRIYWVQTFFYRSY